MGTPTLGRNMVAAHMTPHPLLLKGGVDGWRSSLADTADLSFVSGAKGSAVEHNPDQGPGDQATPAFHTTPEPLGWGAPDPHDAINLK